MPPSTIDALLRTGGLPLTEARALLALALEASRETLIAWPQRPVEPAAAAAFQALARRRAQGEPLAYLLGTQEFFGRSFTVSPAVLIPRPDTELLVEHALTLLRGRTNPRVLDLGTGSGCIAISIALEHPQARVLAVDRSTEALAIAAANAGRLQARVEFVLSDWYEQLNEHTQLNGRFDLIVSNPPYIAAGDAHLPALSHEPAQALTDGADGLNHLRSIGAQATEFLVPGGYLAVEHGYDQGAAVRALFAQSGLHDVQTLRDAAGHERVCCGQAPR